MAPRTSSGPTTQQSLTERLMALAQTLQFAWFVGHVTLLVCTLRYGLSYIFFNYYSRWARFSYRTAFVAAAATYGIVVYKAYRARMKAGKQQSIMPLLADENVHYLAMALLWLFSRQMPLALLPFAVYSVFHVATYTRYNVLPILQPAPPGSTNAPPSALAETIGRFVKEYYDTSMSLVAILEVALWFRILISAIMFQKGSWILLVLYTAFFRVRHSNSSFVQGAVSQLTARADQHLANQSMHPAVRNGWETVKNGVRSAANATDINRVVQKNQAQTTPKKTS